MAGGQGLYSRFSVKPGSNSKLRSKTFFSESKSMTAAVQQGAEVEIPSAFGDVVGLAIKITQVTTGTLSAGKVLSTAVSKFVIKDKGANPIWQNVIGNDLVNLEYFVDGVGRVVTETTTTNASATDAFMMPISIDVKDMPAKIQLEYAAYSSMATGATGGTIQVDITAFYRDGSTVNTSRLSSLTVALASGDNILSAYLPKGRMVNKVLINATETAITEIHVSGSASDELRLKTADINAYLASARLGTKPSNWLWIPCDAFVATDSSQFVITTNTTVASARLLYFIVD